MQKRVWLIIGIRLAILLLFAAAGVTLSLVLAVDLMSFFITATLVILALSAFYALMARFSRRYEMQAFLQLLIDVALSTWMVYRTGGAASPLTLLYLVVVSASSSVLSQRRVYAIASASALLYGVLADSIFNGLIEPRATLFPSATQTGGETLFKVVLNLLAFFVVAALSSSLARRLQGSNNQLATATQRLAELRVFNERVIDSVSSGLVTVDLNGAIKTVNRAAEEITGFQFAAVFDRPATVIFGDISAQIRACLEAPRGKARQSRFTTECSAADGKKMHLGFSVAPLMAEDGTRTGVVISFQDLTEINKLEDEMRRQDRLVALGKMAAAIAHEIRNPLASIRGAVQVMESELELSQDQASLMNIVLRESDRLNGIVTDFLNYARPAPPARQLIDLRQVVAETIKLLRHDAELRSTHRIEESYPEGELPYRADANQMRQICWNLSRNAIQAMPTGGALTVTLETNADQVVISFEDTGCGIAADQLERLFEPFNSKKSGGTGLGLAIVHQIVSDHGGRIEVESVAGRGTKILITLPPSTENSSCDELRVA